MTGHVSISCADCENPGIHKGRGLCYVCYERHRWRGTLNDFPLAIPGVLDHAVVERILNGDWRLSSNQAERRAVCERWSSTGRSLRDLERLTGWRTSRYFHVGSAAA